MITTTGHSLYKESYYFTESLCILLHFIPFSANVTPMSPCLSRFSVCTRSYVIRSPHISLHSVSQGQIAGIIGSSTDLKSLNSFASVRRGDAFTFKRVNSECCLLSGDLWGWALPGISVPFGVYICCGHSSWLGHSFSVFLLLLCLYYIVRDAGMYCHSWAPQSYGEGHITLLWL